MENSKEINLSNEFQVSLLKNFASISWRHAVIPEETTNLNKHFGGDGEPHTFECVADKFGLPAAKAWEQAVKARQDFFREAYAHIHAVEDGTFGTEPPAKEVSVKPLQWSDDNGNLCREQQDGQIELYTFCGRYVIRHRSSVDGAMWVPRYLGHLPLAARRKLSEAKVDCQKDHEARIRAEVGEDGP